MEVIGSEVPLSANGRLSVLKNRVQDKLEQESSRWGINIINVGITDNAKTFPIRLYQ